MYPMAHPRTSELCFKKSRRQETNAVGSDALADSSRGQTWVLVLHPILNELLEFPGFLQEFLGLGVTGHVGRVVVQDVALPPAGIEVIGQVRALRSERNQLH